MCVFGGTLASGLPLFVIVFRGRALQGEFDRNVFFVYSFLVLSAARWTATASGAPHQEL